MEWLSSRSEPVPENVNDNFSLANMSKEVETMKKFLLALAVLCLGTMAYAGPNAGGTLIAHDANLTMLGTDGLISICAQGTDPATCADADVRIDGAMSGDEAIFKVYAAFLEGSAPRLMGITFGCTYAGDPVLTAWGHCGDFELADDTWPAPGTGTSVTWNTVQTAYLTAVYWFAGYQYYGGGTFDLAGNPGQGGGFFGDDSVPAILDAIAGYGKIGFDVDGELVCPAPVENGACCDPETGNCMLTPADQCPPPMIWHPEWQTCEPNPCPPPIILGACCDPATGDCTITEEIYCAGNWLGPDFGCDPNPCEQPSPVESSSWGQIKANYR